MAQPAKASLTSGRSRTSGARPPARHKAWVRKNIIMDQRKLDAARRTLGVGTETEAVDVALDLVAFRDEVVRGIAAVRRAGGIQDVFEKRSV
jgi:hypothetical protein